MKREIICAECWSKTLPLPPEDVANGVHRRFTMLAAHKPAKHGIAIDGLFISMPSLLCDHCDRKIDECAIAYAVTTWYASREGEPDYWERQYAL